MEITKHDSTVTTYYSVVAMRHAVRKKLWVYNYGNRRLESDSLSTRALDALFPDKKKTLPELYRTTKGNVKLVLQRLRKRCLVTKNPDRTYSLTETGRWFAISSRLKISFLELCLLACACCTQQRFAGTGTIGFYLKSTFDSIFKEYYSKRYISVVFSTLRKKGFGVKFVNSALRIYPKTCEGLMSRYGPYFKRLESWLDDLEEKKLDILTEAYDGVELRSAEA